MVRIEFDRESKRAVAFDDDTFVGECTFEENDSVWNINHTFVNENYQGQGIARNLVNMVIENAQKEHKRLIADCSYAAKILEKI